MNIDQAYQAYQTYQADQADQAYAHLHAHHVSEREDRLRARYRSTAAQARDAIALCDEIEDTLKGEQSHSTRRRLDVQDVLRAIVRREDTGRVRDLAIFYVAASYRYPHTWTQARCVEVDDGATLVWGVRRVSASYELSLDHTMSPQTVRGLAWGGALLPGDAIAVRPRSAKSDYYIRYDRGGRRTGVTRRLPDDLGPGWEHGATLRDISLEIAHKREIRRDQKRVAVLCARRVYQA